MELTEQEQAMYRCAYHEAGHGLLSVHFGMHVRSVEINRDGVVDGYTDVDDCDAAKDAGHDAIMTYAGPEAEAIWQHRYYGIRLGAARRDAQRFSARGDMRHFRHAARASDYSRGQLARKAHRLVSSNWRSIDRVADALCTHGRISGNALKRLV